MREQRANEHRRTCRRRWTKLRACKTRRQSNVNRYVWSHLPSIETRCLRRAAILGVIASVVWIAWLARTETTVRLAFDNRGYPPEVIVQFWLDDAAEGALIHARCAIDHCETAAMLISKGRHRIRLRVLVGDQASPFFLTTIER